MDGAPENNTSIFGVTMTQDSQWAAPGGPEDIELDELDESTYVGSSGSRTVDNAVDSA